MTAVRRVFVAGTMQGANQGTKIEDQGYRERIASIVASVLPDAECFDPSHEVTERLRDPDTLAVIGAVVASELPVLATAELPERLGELRSVFLRMTAKVAECDLCVAYLPGTMPSMGTAMEMYAAHCAGVPIATITTMRTNLAIASVSTWLLDDLEAFEHWLRTDSGPTGAKPLRGEVDADGQRVGGD